MNVLVVIDVQNCFMFHSGGMDPTKGGTFLNAGEQASKEIIDELKTLVVDKTHVVFSRDFHPLNHISLEGYESRNIDPAKGIWPKHCRNKTLQCKSRVQGTVDETPDPIIANRVVDTKEGKLVDGNKADDNQFLEVVGTELSYMFFKNQIFREPVRQLIVDNRKGEYKIGLYDTMSESIPRNPQVIEKDDEERKIIYGESLTVDGDSRKYISLTKGERCDKEAYSAFNYHIQYKPATPYDPNNTLKVNIPPSKENSTGLWEWILTTARKENKNKITITVCGLVGNVCVMHSLLQGIALWNNVYSKEYTDIAVKFVYSMQGTRFAVVVPPMKIKPSFVHDNVVDHFNKNIPRGMGQITIGAGAGALEPKVGQIESFEVLNEDGKIIVCQISVAIPKIIMFSDIEGCQASPGNQSTFLCSKPFYNKIANMLNDDQNLDVAFLGDYFDQGMRVYDSIQGMNMLLDGFDGRVHVILGNRDVNKLRFCFELVKRDEIKSSMKNIKGGDIEEPHTLIPIEKDKDGTKVTFIPVPHFEKGWKSWNPYYYGIAIDKIVEPPDYTPKGDITTEVGLVKHILMSSMGAGKSENNKMTGLYSFMPYDSIHTADEETALKYLKAALGIIKSDDRPKDALDLLRFFEKCKLAHVFNGKVLLAHGGGFDPEAFFDQAYVDSFNTGEDITPENYHNILNQFRIKLSGGNSVMSGGSGGKPRPLPSPLLTITGTSINYVPKGINYNDQFKRASSQQLRQYQSGTQSITTAAPLPRGGLPKPVKPLLSLSAAAAQVSSPKSVSAQESVSAPESVSAQVSVSESVDVYNKLIQEVLNEIRESKFTRKFVLLQALGLKPDSEDARYKSLIQSCSQDGCSGPNKKLSNDGDSLKLAKILKDSGITHVSYGHKPICFPIPVIYQRIEVPDVTFISNDTSNGNRKVEEIGENTAIGTMVIFDPNGVQSKIEPIELNGRERKVGNYSAMYDPLTLETTPFYEKENESYVLKYGNNKVVFNKEGYKQLAYVDSSVESGQPRQEAGKRRSRHRKQQRSKRGSKCGGSKRTRHNKHKHTKRGRKAIK